MEFKFLVTEECGRLARWLRLLGYDAAWVKAMPSTELYRKAYSEQRIVLTRNHRVRSGCLFRVVHLTSPTLEEQLRQLIQEFGIAVEDKRLFTRCNLCNVPVDPIGKVCVKERVPPFVYHKQQQFYTCPSCQRIYWAATHWQRACTLLEKLKT